VWYGYLEAKLRVPEAHLACHGQAAWNAGAARKLFMTKLNSFCCFVGCVVLMCSTAAAQAPKPDPFRAPLQMMVVTTPDWDAVGGRLQRYERSQPGKHWKRVGGPITIVVGKKGLGWGAGVTPTDFTETRDPIDPVKTEGDGKSPAGVFTIGSAFGYADQAPLGWKLPYTRLTPTVECVDDTKSHFYNRIVDRATVHPDWNSSEHMASAGISYRWGAVIEHNAGAAPRAGSCVFLHVWSGPDKGTAGCTAMPQEQLEAVLAWLDPAKGPILVQLTTANYKRLKKPWNLPKSAR
jgi:L,D-peptidoglycan transpeptidase YkuD (ErfK/YbiS/YcfS/YnhG family)